MWGFCGILSLGQGAFLGLGGYAYGIAGINFIESHGHTWAALGIGLAVPVLVAAVLGFIMFYARIRGVYVAILMLVVTLLLEAFLNQTAGQGWFIGDAHLGGNNGLGRFSGVIREPPGLSFGLGDSDIEFNGRSRAFYYLVFGLVVVVYLGLRWLVNSKAGRVMIAIREDAERTEALGYDIRLIQLGVFCLGAFLAGLSGILYVSWESFITPSVFGVQNNIPARDLGRCRRPQEPDGDGDRHAGPALALAEAGGAGQLRAGGPGRDPDPGHDAAAGRRDHRPGRAIRGAQAAARARGGGMTGAGDGALLSTRGLAKAFGGVRAVDGVDFSLEPGALRCIIGPNGAGKSTFFKLLLGSIKPDKGAIRFRGRDVTRAEPHRRAHMGIGVKFQHLGVYGDLSVRHNLQLPLQHSLSGEAMDAEIARLLERLNLAGTEERRVAELSHGQRQWLAIGMALAMRPVLLLLDEPTAGMGPGRDPRHRRAGLLGPCGRRHHRRRRARHGVRAPARRTGYRAPLWAGVRRGIAGGDREQRGRAQHLSRRVANDARSAPGAAITTGDKEGRRCRRSSEAR